MIVIAMLAAAAAVPPASPALSADLRCLIAISVLNGMPVTAPGYDAKLKENAQEGAIYYAGRIAGQTAGLTVTQLSELLSKEMLALPRNSVVANVRACADRMKAEGDTLAAAVSAIRTPD